MDDETQGGFSQKTQSVGDETRTRENQKVNGGLWFVGLFFGAVMWTGVIWYHTFQALYFVGLTDGKIFLLACGWSLTAGLWIMSIGELVARRIGRNA